MKKIKLALVIVCNCCRLICLSDILTNIENSDDVHINKSLEQSGFVLIYMILNSCTFMNMTSCFLKFFC